MVDKSKEELVRLVKELVRFDSGLSVILCTRKKNMRAKEKIEGYTRLAQLKYDTLQIQPLNSMSSAKLLLTLIDMRVDDQEVFDLLKNEHNEESLRKKPYCVILE